MEKAEVPDPVIAFVIWHPKFKYSISVPVLYEDEQQLKNGLMVSGLWPLRHGWRVVKVVVTPMEDIN